MQRQHILQQILLYSINLPCLVLVQTHNIPRFTINHHQSRHSHISCSHFVNTVVEKTKQQCLSSSPSFLILAPWSSLPQQVNTRDSCCFYNKYILNGNPIPSMTEWTTWTIKIHQHPPSIHWVWLSNNYCFTVLSPLAAPCLLMQSHCQRQWLQVHLFICAYNMSISPLSLQRNSSLNCHEGATAPARHKIISSYPLILAAAAADDDEEEDCRHTLRPFSS